MDYIYLNSTYALGFFQLFSICPKVKYDKYSSECFIKTLTKCHVNNVYFSNILLSIIKVKSINKQEYIDYSHGLY